MKRLEITIFNLSSITVDNIEFRLDSEYYQQEYLNLYKKLTFSPMLGDLVYMSDLSTNGSFATVAKIKNDSNPKIIPFIRSGNCGDTFINKNELEFISKEAHEQLPKSTTQLHEIMMARKGKIGGASIITEDEVNFNCSENVIKLRILDKNSLNPFYFTVFFNSKYGFKQVERLSTGNVQPWVSIFQIRKLMIPILDYSFQVKIERLVIESLEMVTNSKNKYSQAEEFLLTKIGLQDFKPSKEPVNIKSFKESFGVSGRLDAEYYQVKYDVIENTFNLKERMKLSELVNYPISSGTTPKAGGDAYTDSENGVPFVRAVDLQNGEVLTSNFNYVKPTIHNTILKRTQLKKDDVLLSIAGTVGRCALFTHDIEANINQAVAILRFDETKIKRLFLVVFFNSFIGKEFVSKYSRQGVQTNLNLAEIGDLEIPIIEFDAQIKITELVEESFKLKKQSEHLLEVAKRSVEIAIEENEEVALKYITENI